MSISARYFFSYFLLFLAASLVGMPGPGSLSCCFESSEDIEKKSSILEKLLPADTRIDEIVLEGDSGFSSRAFAQLTDLQPPLSLTVHTIKKALFYLFKKDVYRSITLRLIHKKNHRSLVFDLQRDWRMGMLKIQGILIGKQRYRYHYLLRYGDYFDRGKHAYSLQLITDDLHNQGYFNGQVQDTLTYDERLKMVTVTLAIQSGSQFFIENVSCEMVAHKGVENITLDTLSDQLTARFLIPLKRTYYTKVAINNQIRALQHYLVHHGISPAVIELTQKIDHETQRVTLCFHIELQHKRDFIFFGNHEYTDEQLREQLLLFGPSAWLLPGHILADEISKEYRKKGFLSVQVRAREEGDICYFLIQEGMRTRDEDPQSSFPFGLTLRQDQDELRPVRLDGAKRMEREGRMEYGIEFQESDITFGKTIIAYPSLVPERYMLRELAYKEGNAWNQEKVNRSLERLKRLGIFDSVQLLPFYDPYTRGQKSMILKAIPDDPYELRVRGGISLQQMSKEFAFKTVAFVGGGTFIMKNPFNKADQVILEVDYTRGERTVTAKYIRPWIFNYPLKCSFQTYATQYWQPSLVNEHKNLYEFRQQGGLLGLQYVDNYSVEVNTGVEWMETALTTHYQNTPYAREVARALNFEPQLLDKRVPFFTVEPTFIFDTADNKLNPHHGSLTVITLKGMFPLQYRHLTSYFLKLFADQSVYVPLKKMVLALRLRFGHIFHHNFKNIMPAERFYAGGANSIRSYNTDLCPPLGVVVSANPNSPIIVPQGAQSMVTMNVELRFPVYKIFSAAVFQDLGALSNTMFADIRMKNILAGTGFGVRINTPIGPLRFDVAFKWQRPGPGSSHYAWFLTFGNAF